MQTECYRIQIRPGALPIARQWAAHLQERSEEVRELLEKEGMAVESAFLDHVGGTDYLVYYLRAVDLDQAWKASQSSQHPIDVFHREMMKQIGECSTRLECLIDFSTIDPK